MAILYLPGGRTELSTVWEFADKLAELCGAEAKVILRDDDHTLLERDQAVSETVRRSRRIHISVGQVTVDEYGTHPVGKDGRALSTTIAPGIVSGFLYQNWPDQGEIQEKIPPVLRWLQHEIRPHRPIRRMLLIARWGAVVGALLIAEIVGVIQAVAVWSYLGLLTIIPAVVVFTLAVGPFTKETNVRVGKLLEEQRGINLLIKT